MFEHILLAIVQGLTEFLPVSSSGHIVLAQELLSLEYDLFIVIWLHVSSLAAVVIYYWKDIVALVRDFFAMLTGREHAEGMLALKLGMATIITAFVGLLFAKHITNKVSLILVGSMLIITALMIFIAERIRTRSENQHFDALHVLGVGLAQGFAVIPGLSRSGTTIAYLIASGIDRTESVRISFLLSIPAITGSLVFALADPKNLERSFEPTYIIIFLIGFASSLASIKLMNTWIHKFWVWFIPYCLILGTSILLFL